MAFVTSTTTPEEQNKLGPQGQTTSNPQSLTPPQTGGSAGAGMGGAKTSPNAGSPTQFGSSASRLGDYLKANAPQVQQQANTIAGGLGNQYGQLQNDINKAVSGFGQQVTGGYAAPDQDIVNQAVANPSAFAANPENVKKFQAQYNNAYTGPANFEGTSPYSTINGAVDTAIRNAGIWNSPGGIEANIRGMEKNPTPGQTTLDSLLLQMSPQAIGQVQQAAGKFSGLPTYLQDQSAEANKAVPAAQKAAKEAQTSARGLFNPYVQGFGNKLNEGAKQAEAQRTAYNQGLNNFYNQVVPVEQTINQWAGSTYGAPGVQDFFAPVLQSQKPVTNAITVQNVATPEQYAQAEAIQRLVGGTAQLPINQSMAAAAGTAPQIPGVPATTLHDILAKSFPGIVEAYNKSFQKAKQSGANKGDVVARPVQDQYTNLINYLEKADPRFTELYGKPPVTSAQSVTPVQPTTTTQSTIPIQQVAPPVGLGAGGGPPFLAAPTEKRPR